MRKHIYEGVDSEGFGPGKLRGIWEGGRTELIRIDAPDTSGVAR